MKAGLKIYWKVAGTNGKIKHSGVVEKVEGQLITVRVVQQQACSACNSKASCHISGDADKLVEVVAPENIIVSLGETVFVYLKLESGIKALFLGYIIPLIFLVAVLFMVYHISGSEAWAAMGSLAALSLYYAGLFFFRSRLRKNFTFELEKLKGDSLD